MKLALFILCFALTGCVASKPYVEAQPRTASFEHVEGLPDDPRALNKDNPDFKQPKMIGGLASLGPVAQYLARDRDCPVRGRVIVQYVVNEQGAVEHAQTVSGIHEVCDAIAAKAFAQARFEPGTLKGVPIKMMLTSPMTFK